MASFPIKSFFCNITTQWLNMYAFEENLNDFTMLRNSQALIKMHWNLVCIILGPNNYLGKILILSNVKRTSHKSTTAQNAEITFAGTVSL
jgi:hypothetical protein